MIEPRPYQLRAIESAFPEGRPVESGIIKSPAGSGKTIIAALILKRYEEEQPPLQDQRIRCLWLANTIDQCRQALRAIETVELEMEVTIRCASPALRNIDLRAFDLLIVDECHHASAPMWEEIISRCTMTEMKLGFSATPFPDEFRREAVQKILGKVICEVSREEVASYGGIIPAHVNFIRYPFTSVEAEARKAAIPAVKAEMDKIAFMRDRSKWSSLQAKSAGEIGNFVRMVRKLCKKYGNGIVQAKLTEDEQRRLMNTWRKIREEKEARVLFQFAAKYGFAAHEQRNEIIIEIANQHVLEAEDSVLILIGSIAHGLLLREEIPGAEICHSKVGKKVREGLIEDFKSGKLRCMIATSLADEGLDVPRANILILAGGGRSGARIEQRTGRVLRTFHGKSRGVIYDFFDTQHYYLLAQSKRREKLYQSLNYHIETIDFDQWTTSPSLQCS